jgi:murein DD-endopeptidase MepM/ murein hydrolase activator NlpD
MIGCIPPPRAERTRPMVFQKLISRFFALPHGRITRAGWSIFYPYVLMIALGLFSVGSVVVVGSPRGGGSGTLFSWGSIGGGEGGRPRVNASYEMAEVWWEGGTNTHVVEDGDDLWTLASDYGVQVEDIVRMNGFSYARRLRRGQELRIPTPAGMGSDLMNRCLPRLDFYPGASAQIEWPPVTKTVHVVQSGENLWDISRHYGVDVPTLFGANDFLDGGYIYPGEEIVVLSQKGILVRVKAEKTLGEIADRYRVPLATVARANHLNHDLSLIPGQEVFVPGGRPLDRGTFIWPLVRFGRISSGFGYRFHPILHRRQWHSGIDLTASYGTPIRAARAGRVVSCGWSGSLGKTIVLRHDMGFQTVYGHCSQIRVKGNQYVKKGQIIGSVGNTGRATGPHLHFEVHKSGRVINPLRYLPFW